MYSYILHIPSYNNCTFWTPYMMSLLVSCWSFWTEFSLYLLLCAISCFADTFLYVADLLLDIVHCSCPFIWCHIAFLNIVFDVLFHVLCMFIMRHVHLLIFVFCSKCLYRPCLQIYLSLCFVMLSLRYFSANIGVDSRCLTVLITLFCLSSLFLFCMIYHCVHCHCGLLLCHAPKANCLLSGQLL